MSGATLETTGIETALDRAWSLSEAREYCRKLAGAHYENFVVATFFLPKHLKRHFYNLYAYCRISDDLGDEVGDPARALQLLGRWESELHACYEGRRKHPVFIALAETIDVFGIPIEPFADLLIAFKQDQTKTRYATYDELLDYCRYSANPVGRLLLFLFRYADTERQQLSDFTCTALQLANHWQDIATDLTRLNRIYLPREDMDRFGYTEEDLRKQICDGRFASLMQLEIERARNLFKLGIKLSEMVDRKLALDVEMFGRFGLEILRLIESRNYDVFRHRPVLSKWRRLQLLAGIWWSRKPSV